MIFLRNSECTVSDWLIVSSLVCGVLFEASGRVETYSVRLELCPNRLRTKQIVLARNLYNVLGIINGVLVPVSSLC